MVYTAVGALTKAVGLLSLPVFTRILSEEEFGRLTLYMTVLGLLSVIASPWYSGNAIYKGMLHFKEREEDFLSSSYGLFLIFTIPLILLSIPLARGIGVSLGLLSVIYLQLLLDGAVGLYLSYQRQNYGYLKAARISLLLAILPPIISFVLIRVFSLGLYGRILGILLVSLAVGGALLVKMVKNSAQLVHFAMWRYTAGLCLPMLPQGISSAASAELDKLVLVWALGERALAGYSVAHTLGLGLSFLTTALGYALMPWIMRRLERGEDDRIGEVVETAHLVMAAATVFLVALSPELMRFLAPRAYSEAIWAVLPVALSVLPSFLSSILVAGLIHRGGGFSLSLGAIAASLTNLSLSLLLIPRLSYFGAGLSLLVSSLTSLAVNSYLVSRRGVKGLVPNGGTLTQLAFTAALGTVMLLLYNYSAVRILLLIPPALIGTTAVINARGLIFEKKQPEK